MSTPPAQADRLRRPPVRQSTTVRSDVRHTFDTFVATIGAWWPAVPFSAGKDQVRSVTVQPRAGGRVYETWADGTEVDWGELLAWEPPARFVMTWTMTPVPTEVQLSFTALGPALTRVTVEHRGWDALTDQQLAEDCALPGGYASGGYAVGWARILDRFAAACARGSDARGSDARGSDARGSDARGSDARGSDARGSDARGSDARAADGGDADE